MNELTLTGGTLLGDTRADGGSGANASATSTSVEMTGQTSSAAAPSSGNKTNQPLAATTTLQVKTSNCQAHGHSHSHSHAHAMPTLSLNMPIAELIVQDTSTILNTLFSIVRMGTFELYQDVVTTWNDNSADATTASIHQEIASARDKHGHTLLHWAAKRIDDVRFVKALVTVVPSQSAAASSSGLVKSLDDTQMTPLHWACATSPEDVARVSAASGNSHHQGALKIIKILLQHDRYSLESVDSTGCTPLLIAAQHGNVMIVAYLIQCANANIHALDSSRDSATHWAAYKGSVSVLGLLSFYDIQQYTIGDVYQQTPLHLAALRGHVSVCRYILHQLIIKNSGNGNGVGSTRRSTNSTTGNSGSGGNSLTTGIRQALDLLQTKDKNGRTPYALAVHKEKSTVAAFLKQKQEELQQQLQFIQSTTNRNNKRGVVLMNSGAASRVSWQLTRRNMKQFMSLQNWKEWLGFDSSSYGTTEAGAYEEMQSSPQFPYYYVIINFALHLVFYLTTFLPVFSTGSGVLWDYMLTHIWQLLLWCAGVIFFYKTKTTNPGRMDSTFAEINTWRQLYERTLESYANEDDDSADSQKLSLCHTCHIARPPRSKHDKYSHVCVLVFDHHCPFVGTTIGLYNYKYFYMFLLMLTLYLMGFVWMLIVYCARESKIHGATPVFALVFGLFLGLHVFFSGGMLIYHTQLVLVNLTTNESLNKGRYHYLWQSNGSHRQFRNPYDRGWYFNCYDRLLEPSAKSYLLEEQTIGLLRPQHLSQDIAGADDDQYAV